MENNLVGQLRSVLETMEADESAEIERVRAVWAERRSHVLEVVASIPSPVMVGGDDIADDGGVYAGDVEPRQLPAADEPKPTLRVGGGAAVMTREDWARVAELADQEERAGRSPRHAIAAEFGVPLSTAKNWPATARVRLATWANTDDEGDAGWQPVTGLPVERLEEVAAVAREAFAATRPILTAIERKFDVSHSCADELLAECRRRHILPPKGEPMVTGLAADMPAVMPHRPGAGLPL